MIVSGKSIPTNGPKNTVGVRKGAIAVGETVKDAAGKVVEWKKFTVNYNHCMFCGLCVETCPTEVLHMTQVFDMSEYDRKNCLVDFLHYRGLRP